MEQRLSTEPDEEDRFLRPPFPKLISFLKGVVDFLGAFLPRLKKSAPTSWLRQSLGFSDSGSWLGVEVRLRGGLAGGVSEPGSESGSRGRGSESRGRGLKTGSDLLSDRTESLRSSSGVRSLLIREYLGRQQVSICKYIM